MQKIFALLILLGLLALAGLGYYANRPLSLPDTPFEFELKQGSSLKSTARDLRQAGLLQQSWVFVWLGRIQGKAIQLKAGRYALDHPVSTLELLDIVTKGDVIQSVFSVIEGWTFKQLRDELNGNPDITHDTLNLSDRDILQRIGAAESHPEGLFFPDTYYFVSGSSDLEIFKRAYQAMQQRLQESWQVREPGLPIENAYQALILASIVEKETGTTQDRAMIAGVFVNRLRKGMLLQTDPTVIYGLGSKYDGNLHKRDLQADNPYNTYTRPGLTPTPISLPGLAALQAAMHPAQTDALYFVARGDGSSHFSSDLSGHNRAVNKYQK